MPKGAIRSQEIKDYLDKFKDEKEAIRQMELDFEINKEIIKERIKYLKR